jgi:hypothetical protein
VERDGPCSEHRNGRWKGQAEGQNPEEGPRTLTRTPGLSPGPRSLTEWQGSCCVHMMAPSGSLSPEVLGTVAHGDFPGIQRMDSAGVQGSQARQVRGALSAGQVGAVICVICLPAQEPGSWNRKHGDLPSLHNSPPEPWIAKFQCKLAEEKNRPRCIFSG